MIGDNTKKAMSEQERRELAAKLDAELDQFIETLGANRKKGSDAGERKPFNLDEWCREIDQHPAFMQDLKPATLQPDGQFPESIQALQALKYDVDPEEEAKDICERAEQSKKEGNKFFGFKKYRSAVECYTNGIKLMCTDRRLNSQLYANRAAAQKHLGNTRSAFRDCLFARRFDPHNAKAVLRGAECLLEMGYGQQCLEWIDSSTSPAVATLDALQELRRQAEHLLQKEERDSRREKKRMTAEMQKKLQLLDEFRKRALRFRPPISYHHQEAEAEREAPFEWSQFEVRLGQLDKVPVVRFCEESKQLVWPLLLQYPEAAQTDLIAEFEEEATLEAALAEVLDSPAEWDTQHNFRADNVRIFVALDRFDEECIAELSPTQTLKEVLSLRNVTITQGLPVLQLYTRAHLEGKLEKMVGGGGKGRGRYKWAVKTPAVDGGGDA